MPIFKWLLSNCIWAAGWAVVAITIPHNYYSGHTTGSNWIIWAVGGQTAASRHRSDAGLLHKQSSGISLRITYQDDTGKAVEPCCLWELQLRPGCSGALGCPPDSGANKTLPRSRNRTTEKQKYHARTAGRQDRKLFIDFIDSCYRCTGKCDNQENYKPKLNLVNLW